MKLIHEGESGMDQKVKPKNYSVKVHNSQSDVGTIKTIRKILAEQSGKKSTYDSLAEKSRINLNDLRKYIVTMSNLGIVKIENDEIILKH